MDKIILYADEFSEDVWASYCDICEVPVSSTKITIYFDRKKVEHE